ncbi:MFS transporter [Leucobacter luti]|uniref:Cyanate permease n=1 Tax=Leucobacter luti TaxID=340320 RepID=A0A4Q7TUT5_9MICO|nr:MFS transporter [Leucobacter luti]MBL3698399.1 MFS transporter [Leucobacter luti]RZT64513.1 cyanate permease [Leucobacter luti]
MTTDNAVTVAARQGVDRLLVPTFIAIELFAGLIQGWIMPLLGEIAQFHGVPAGSISLYFMITMLSSAMSVPFLSMLADRFGKRRLLVIAVLLTAVGTAMIAFAPSFAFVLIGSAVQGPVAALLPIEMGILKQQRPENAKRIVSALVGTLTFGVALGSLCSGVLMDATGDLALTQAIPAIPLFLLGAAVMFCLPRDAGNRTSSVDWTGAVLFSASLGALMYGLTAGTELGWLHPGTIAALLGGVIGSVVFVLVESRAASPLLDFTVLRRVKLGVPMILGFLVALTAFGISTPTTLYLTADPTVVGYGTGLSAGTAGLLVSVIFLSSSLGAFLAPVAVRLLGTAWAISVATLISAGSLLALITAPTSPVVVTILLAINSLMSWVALGILPGVIVARAPLSVATTLSGLYNCLRSLGGSVAGAVVAAVMATLVLAQSDADAVAVPALSSFQVIWGVFAGCLIASAVLALLLARSRSNRTEAIITASPEPLATR